MLIKNVLVVGAIVLAAPFLSSDVYASISNNTTQAEKDSPPPIEDQGDYYFGRGLYEDAIRIWRKQYKGFRENQDLAGQIIILYKISTAQRMMGLHDRSIRGLEVASKLSGLLNDADLSVMIKANLGGAYLYTGQLDLAKPLLTEALLSAEKSANKRLSALIHNDLGNLYSFTGQADRAFDAFYKSGNLAIVLGDSYLVVQALANAINLATEKNMPDTALIDLERAVNFVSRLEASYQKALGVEKVGVAAYNLLEEHQPEDKALFYQVISQLSEQASYAGQLENHWLAAGVHLSILQGRIQ